MKNLFLHVIFLVFVCAAFGQSIDSTTSRVNATKLPVCEMFISQENLNKLNEDVYRDEYVPAAVTVDGVHYDNVKIRYRGLTSRDAPKKSYKINFKSSNRHNGRDKINLKAEYYDKSMMREYLSFQLLTEVGLHASQTRFVHLRLNNEFIGVYLDVENIDEFFLRDHRMNENGNLYKAAGQNSCTLTWLGDKADDYMALYEKKTNESEGWDDFIDFIFWINFSSDEEFVSEIESKLNLELYFEWIAVNHIVENFDVYHKNYYLFHDLERDIWEVIPYDYDYAFGHGEPPDFVIDNPLSIGKRNVLFRRVYDTPQLRNRMKTAVIKNLNSLFSTDRILPAIDSTYFYIQEDAYLDTFKASTNAEFDFHYNLLKEFVHLRTDFILDELTRDRLYINEFLADNETVFADEYGEYDDWIEIFNPFEHAKNLKYFYLTDDLNQPMKWALPDTTIPGLGSLLIWADGQDEQGKLHTNFKLKAGGESLGIFFEEQIVDAIEFDEQAEDVSFGRSTLDKRNWLNFQFPTPGEDEITLNYHIPETGWYLFSLPIDAIDKNVTSIFPNNTVAFAWQDTGYSQVKTLEIGVGYWINVADTGAYSLTGKRIFSYKRHFEQGWQLIAAPGKSTTISGITTQPDSCVQAVYIWNSVEQSYQAASNFSPFEACWIYVSRENDFSFNLCNADSGKTLQYSYLPPPPPFATYVQKIKELSPLQYKLDQNYPNPFNCATTFSFQLPARVRVNITVYDVIGRVVIKIADTYFEAGSYKLSWNGVDGNGNALPSGIYFCHFSADQFRATVKSIILR